MYWRVIAANDYRDLEANGTKIGEKTMAAEKRYVGVAMEVLSRRTPPSPRTR